MNILLFLIALSPVVYACLLLREAMYYQKYTRLRYRLFKLRDQVLSLALDGKIPEETAIDYYNGIINWAALYVKEFPAFTIFGFVMAYEKLKLPEAQGELRQRIEQMPPELKEWHCQFSKLTLDCIKTYTPLRFLTNTQEGSPIGELVIFSFAVWLFFTLLKKSNHPLTKSIYGSYSFSEYIAQVKTKAIEEAKAISQTQRLASEFQRCALSPA